MQSTDPATSRIAKDKSLYRAEVWEYQKIRFIGRPINQFKPSLVALLSPYAALALLAIVTASIQYSPTSKGRMTVSEFPTAACRVSVSGGPRVLRGVKPGDKIQIETLGDAFAGQLTVLDVSLAAKEISGQMNVSDLPQRESGARYDVRIVFPKRSLLVNALM